jgi:hypothetical protein
VHPGDQPPEFGPYRLVELLSPSAVANGHEAKITQLGVVSSGDRPLLVSVAADNTIRV